jgi:hypothetical protein
MLAVLFMFNIWFVKLLKFGRIEVRASCIRCTGIGMLSTENIVICRGGILIDGTFLIPGMPYIFVNTLLSFMCGVY